MRFDWLLGPLVPYILLVLGSLACLGICISTSIRMRRERRAMTRSQEFLGETVSALSAAVGEIRRENREPDIPPAPVLLAGLNLTKRTQALRMHRRGEAVSTIAAALESPRNEIELLLKLHGSVN